MVRPGADADVAVAAGIDALVSDQPWQPDSLSRYFNHESHCHALVLEQSGDVWGFLIYALVLDEASVDNVAVLPEAQGMGYGRLLLDTALQQMQALGAVRCMLEVRESNVAARGLYEKRGFQLDGRRRDYYKTAEGREDALLMSRRW
ncbi:hypothetical protein A3709_15145 [Halioglobus sp. HI00S01]|uniref:ribosomal protein S18-alanine N-acetyltransferase n=1 Tax=Halioglobus sp. HI00S01 TaxID=1822214 RepID=UPI0007C29DB9|nr:ribosomal protein S18-alanine N-acetyltransferase [Halioglobus sp. HI00S01]KZX59614.1 hypothetical protein A3709_15145 [Halioglobus sp. HI00S01]